MIKGPITLISNFFKINLLTHNSLVKENFRLVKPASTLQQLL